MAVTRWLIDKSALGRLVSSRDAEEWARRIERGLVHISTLTLLEIGYSARTAGELRAGLQEPPLASMPVEYLTPTIEDRALEVLVLLAEHGQHRAPSLADVIIAAIAERNGLTVLHVDKDFELIVGITSQPAEKLRLR